MKRLNLLLALSTLIVPAVVLAAEPCPPPQVSVSGGTSATTNCAIVATGSSYSTNFALTENPISEGGKWINGKAVGLNWNNVQTTTGKAFAAGFVAATGNGRYSDPIAHLNTSFTANQYAEATVSRVPGYKNLVDKHEVELLLRFKITASSARGYEVLWGQDGGMCVVRWNGPLGDYTLLGDYCTPDSPTNEAVDGDVLRAEISGNLIKVYRNGKLVHSISDPNSTWNDGQPGMGFWPTPGSTLSAYGWKSFRAGSL